MRSGESRYARWCGSISLVRCKAIQFCINHWRALTRFRTDGSIPMTNNLAERDRMSSSVSRVPAATADPMTKP
jgi:hypothetical protein